MREELLKEQVMGSYRKDLMVFLTEKGFTNLEEVVTMAEQYKLAHVQLGSNPRRDRLPEVIEPEESAEIPPKQNGVQLKPQGQPTNS